MEDAEDVLRASWTLIDRQSRDEMASEDLSLLGSYLVGNEG
jgi:hypothetical protein